MLLYICLLKRKFCYKVIVVPLLTKQSSQFELLLSFSRLYSLFCYLMQHCLVSVSSFFLFLSQLDVFVYSIKCVVRLSSFSSALTHSVRLEKSVSLFDLRAKLKFSPSTEVLKLAAAATTLNSAIRMPLSIVTFPKLSRFSKCQNWAVFFQILSIIIIRLSNCSLSAQWVVVFTFNLK